ncbi:unnamed protein product [Gadus morhua 'NCC']
MSRDRFAIIWRKGIPKKLAAMAKHKYTVSQKDELTFCAWQDTKTVLVLSNFHAPTATGTVKRRHGGTIQTEVTVPACLTDYQRHMKGVDLLYQMLTTTQADAKTQLSLPRTPRIILLAKQWMLALEGKVFITPTNLQMDFTSALAVLFGSYYAFNIEYQPEAASTLDFIQRFLVRINPEFSKCTAKFQMSKKTNKMVQRKQVALNPHVAGFIRDFTKFDWQNF